VPSPLHGVTPESDTPSSRDEGAQVSSELRERRWVHAIRAGDASAFEALFREYHARLCSFAYRFTGSRDIAEELVQETFLYVWQHRETLDIRDSMKTYLFSSVRNASVSWLRHERVVSQSTGQTTELFRSSSDTADHELESTEIISAVRMAIARLPEGSRMVLTLHREQGMTYREIADVLGISPKTVDAQMGRAFKALRKYLGPHWP
jgi:RNA polymerase sigma-70 factor, ECF subfamily